MRVNVRDISERIELDMALIEKVVERSKLWIRGRQPADSICKAQSAEYLMGCIEINYFPHRTQPYLEWLIAHKRLRDRI